jgi:hypothetical protein
MRTATWVQVDLGCVRTSPVVQHTHTASTMSKSNRSERRPRSASVTNMIEEIECVTEYTAMDATRL